MCTFCDWEQDEFLVEANAWGAILVDRAPLCAGHLLVVAPRHVSSLLDLLPAERSRFEARIETASRIAAEIGGRPAVAFEHGRSPTCGDPTGSCHAHVHIVPVGDPRQAMLEESGLLAERETPRDPYLAIRSGDGAWHRYQPARPLLHGARTLATLVGEANGAPWWPLGVAPPDLAADTLCETRRRSNPPAAVRRMTVPRRARRPVVTVSGPTGAGKTTVGAHLAATLGVPAIELGVVMRLLCISETEGYAGTPGERLWRWASRGRVDFGGAGTRGLAAALPRLDGAAEEIRMWRGIEGARLAALAREPEVQEVLEELVRRVALREGAVIIGRVAPRIEGASAIWLDAAAATRARRKRTQLARIGLTATEHDWFDPGPSRQPGDALDTDRLSPAEMRAAVMQAVGLGESRGTARLAS
jgi:cytidylate kinase/diadenosine tetraphosphate (Ap4A) HIT family hydrolase